MPSSDRDDSRDRELVRHSHSFSTEGRFNVPMWDSSDPDRAPPPLPLNPGSPSLTIRPNASAAIANAAKALEEKARESLPASSYTTNPMPQRSPERSLVKGAQHKRMQSLQPNGLRDLRSYLDTHKSPERSPERSQERSPERPATRAGTPPRPIEKDYFGDHSPSRLTTPTPSSRDAFKETPALRPSSRPLQKSILGENTPPSATMMALQTMSVPPHMMDPPLTNGTNGSNSPSRTPQPVAQPAPHSFDAISNQLVSITSIVSNLQKDMSQLARRSKDNATDLVSLKEATSSRDEDIRKSLKDLLSTMNHAQQANVGPEDFSRSGSSMGVKDPHMTPTKKFSLPQISSPNFMMDPDRMGSPNPYSVEGAASVAMLEKIIREMVTKDGQERLVTNLQKLVDKATGDTAKKVTELVEFVKQGSPSHALVSTASSGSPPFQQSPGTGPLTRTTSEGFSLHKVADGSKPYASPKAADFVSEEMLKFLRRIKDSVAESGCVTMGTKALIQDLRGEVLGMGRELARKIEEAEQTKADQPTIESAQSNQDIGAIVHEELANLKQHLDTVMRERRRQSISSIATRNTVDSNEVYDVVKQALAERGLDHHASQPEPLDKEAIIAAVREAYEAYQPNIQVEPLGLNPDEVLQCLREGLQEYQGSGNISKEEIEQVVQESIQHIKLPQPINEAHEIRDEVLFAVRECLEDLKPSLAPAPSTEGLLRETIVETINNAISSNVQVELDPDSLSNSIHAALVRQPGTGGHSEEVIQRLQSLLDEMHSEFTAYSAANGRDTEQVLDALRDGLDSLRTEIESYVDKAQDVTQRDDIVESIRDDLEKLRADVQSYVAEGPRGDQESNRGDMVNYIKSEFENLHEAFTSELGSMTKDKQEILDALNAGFEAMKSQVVTRDLDLDSNEDINAAIKQEFESLKDVIIGDTANHKDEVLERLQTGFDALHTRLGDGVASAGNDEVISSLKEEFEHLRETLGVNLLRSGGEADKDDIIDAVRELIDGLRMSHENASKENFTSVQEALDNLKESLGSTLVPVGDASEKMEILHTLKSDLEELKVSSKTMGFSEELLEALRGEMEQVRDSNGLTRQHARADTEEVLEALRLGLDDLRSHLEKKLDNPEGQMSAQNEIIDAVNEGLESMRSDISKVADKPVDMTVSYEILDTLKEGLASLRQDIDKLKGKNQGVNAEGENLPTGNEVVLAEETEQTQSTSRNVVDDSLCRNDIEKMEVMLGQLQVKMEAMDANIQHPVSSEPAMPVGAVVKDDLTGIEELLKDVQAAVLVMQEREPTTSAPPAAEGLATKEDTDAIETVLGNLKAKIEEIVLPDPATAVTKENLDDVELVVRTTSETLEALAKKIEEESATKADVTVVQVIADDIKQALDEMKAAKPDDEENPKATKADLDALSLLADDIKFKLDDMRLPDPEELPTKADVEQLTGLLHDFRDSHDKMKDIYEQDIIKTAKNFDDRKKEAEDIVTYITESKTALDEFKEEIKTNLIEGGPIENLKDSFKTLEDSIGTKLNVTDNVKELMETLEREFQRAHGSIEALQNDQAEKSALSLEKHDEAKEVIVSGLVEKIDDRFNTLMAKYDDAQLLADEQARVMKEKAEEQEKILESTKTMADELRVSIDTLGSSITGMNEQFEEATKKWATDSETVFNKIDETVTKLEEQKLEDKTEHSHTRDEIKNIENIFNGLQDNVTEYHPKFMVALREIEALVKVHYEHSQKAKDEADERMQSMNEEAKARSEELSNHFSSLPALLPPPPPAIELPEKYDDGPVQEKLDKLLGHVDEAEKSSTQLERLDEIHGLVKSTAAEVSELVTKQTQLITDGNEAKEREAEELALLVERRNTQKEQLEADIEGLRSEKTRVVEELKDEKERAMAELKEEKERTIQELKEEKDSLLSVVAALQAERENLANQKVRLTGEVSSLHTALDIRREELNMMDTKADALERRILNGIMDHSRALMIAKGQTKSPSKPKKRMSTDMSADSTKLMPPSAAANGLSMALKPRPAIRRNGPPANPASRRIHSLSQISGNTPTGGQAYHPPAGNSMSNNSGGLKRSHSVKTNYLRKSSWGGKPNAAVANKENETLNEQDEIESESPAAPPVIQDTIEEDNLDDVRSETGTERRHSFASGSYAEGETPGFDGRSSFGGTGSEYTYASGSYMTGSDIDRRTSYGSTAARSAAQGGEETVGEGSEASDSHYESESEVDEPTATINPAPSEVTGAPSEVTASGVTASEVTASEVTEASDRAEALPTDSEVNRAVEAVMAEMKDEPHLYTAPTDSAIGTDLPTAALGNDSEADADYFRRAAEEEESTVG